MILKTIFEKATNGRGAGWLKRLSLAMASGIATRITTLAFAIVIGRSFGASDFGAFTFATGLAIVLGQIATLGWPQLTNRLLPKFREQADWGAMRGLFRSANVLVLIASVFASLVLLAIAQFASDLSRSLYFCALLIPPYAFCILRRQQLAALKKAHLGILFDRGLGAAFTVLLFVLAGGLVLDQTVVIYAAATGIGTILTGLLAYRAAPAQAKTARPSYAIRSWLMLGLPILVGITAKLLLGNTGVLLLAPLSTLTETGIFGAASRVTYLLTFPQTILMALVVPALSTAFAKKSAAQVRLVARLSLLFTTVTLVPFLIIILLFAEQILATVFGPQFVDGAVPLQLLALGQAANGFGMVFASMLMMGGREKAFAGWNVLMLSLSVGLHALLIPLFGATGAALATAGVSAVLLAAQAWLARPLWNGTMVAHYPEADAEGANDAG